MSSWERDKKPHENKSSAVPLLCNAGKLGKKHSTTEDNKIFKEFCLLRDTHYTWIQKATNYTLLFQLIYAIEKISTKFSFLQVT